VSSIKDLRLDIREKQRILERLRAIENELETVRGERKSLESRIAGIRANLEPHFEGIGAAAFDLYRLSPGSFEEAAELLADMHELEEGIRQKERALAQLQASAESASFFEKTIKMGRGMVLRGSLKSRELQRGKRLKLVGEHICGFADLSALEADTALARRLGPVREAVEDLQAARRRQGELDLEQERLTAERLEIERGLKVRNPLRNLEHELKKLENELSDRLGKLGELFYASRKDMVPVSGRMSKTVSAIEENEEEQKLCAGMLKRVEAGLEIKRLQKRKESLDAEISALNAKIQELQGAKAGIDGEIAAKHELLGDPGTLKVPELKS